MDSSQGESPHFAISEDIDVFFPTLTITLWRQSSRCILLLPNWRKPKREQQGRRYLADLRPAEGVVAEIIDLVGMEEDEFEEPRDPPSTKS